MVKGSRQVSKAKCLGKKSVSMRVSKVDKECKGAESRINFKENIENGEREVKGEEGNGMQRQQQLPAGKKSGLVLKGTNEERKKNKDKGEIYKKIEKPWKGNNPSFTTEQKGTD